MPQTVDPRYRPIAPRNHFRLVGHDLADGGESWLAGDFSSLTEAVRQAANQVNHCCGHIQMEIYDSQGCRIAEA